MTAFAHEHTKNMNETFSPDTSTMTLEFDMDNWEDNKRYSRIKRIISDDACAVDSSTDILNRNWSPSINVMDPLPSGEELSAVDAQIQMGVILDGNPSRDNEIMEMKEKIRQLELENFNLASSATMLRWQIKETRYEV